MESSMGIPEAERQCLKRKRSQSENLDNPDFDVEVIIGSYEEFLLGYRLVKDENGYQLSQSFTNHAHAGSVRCVASDNTILASGGADEKIQVFNMKKRRELGMLQHHDGTITCLQFCDGHLFSSSEDGTIAKWNIKKWDCKKTLSGKKKIAINSFSVHPSGKIAASVSSDKTVCMWNLAKSQIAFTLKKRGSIVEWSPNGDFMLLSCESPLKGSVEIHNSNDPSDIYKIELDKPVHSLTFVNKHVCAIGKEDGEIIIYNIKRKKELRKKKLHTSRIKGLKAVLLENNKRLLFSVSSDGYLKAWQLGLKKEAAVFKKLAETNTACRPTCITVMVQKSDPDPA